MNLIIEIKCDYFLHLFDKYNTLLKLIVLILIEARRNILIPLHTNIICFFYRMKLLKNASHIYALIIYSICLSIYGQSDINFKSLVPTVNNESIFVTKTVQDSLGVIWMSSTNGIIKYNGYSYTFVKKDKIFESISQNENINTIYTDSKKNIWIRTNFGQLCKYNLLKGDFENISHLVGESVAAFRSKSENIFIATKNGNIYTYSDNTIDSITSIPDINTINNKVEQLEINSAKKEIYVSTSKGKLFVYSLQTKKLRELIGPYTDYPGALILQLDNNDKLWIGTEVYGLLVYDLNKNKFIQNTFFKGDTHNIHNELFISVFLDSNQNLWGGTDGDGLYVVNTLTGTIDVHKKDNSNKYSIGSNTIMHINEDNHKNIWVVNNYGSVNVIPKPNKDINYHKGSSNNIPTRILSVFKNEDGSLWLGTDGSGLTVVDADSKTTQYFYDGVNNFYVQSITQDEEGNMWFGTYKSGLFFYNQKLKTFEKIPVVNNLNQLATDVRTVYKDFKGRIWVGSNVGLNIYSKSKRVIASFSNNQNGLNGLIVESIIEDLNNTIWIGQYGGGLFKFIENNDNINYSSFSNISDGFNELVPRAYSLSIGKPNELWLINGGNKLLSFDTKNNTFNDYNDIIAIKEKTFNAVVAEDGSSIWASSSNGILHFDVKKRLTNVYYETDGLQSNFFMSRSVFKDKHGVLYFGSTMGVNYFDPKKLSKQKCNAQLFINEIEILNRPAKDLLFDQITSDITNLEKIRLKDNQSSFSVKFSAIDNILSTNYNYSYKLDGFDKNWKTTYTEGIASYTNIPPGDYLLKIKAYETNETPKIYTKNLAIVIEPPFWNTAYAYFVYIFLFGLLFYGCYKWYYLRKKLLINRISRRKEKELHRAKMKFFTKMSHEIQTPITLILGPINDMLKRAEVNGNMLLKERLSIISDNAKRLSRIARELTLVRNREHNKLRLFVTQNNLYQDIQTISLSFKEFARSKKIDFSVNCPKNLLDIWYDKEKLEHILYNLLSNAFKYTPIEGNVQLLIVPIKNKSFIKISVSDSGAGIDKSELDQIFELFYRSDTNKMAKGSGIGLALTKELVQLHKGKIKVNSTHGEGTVFTIKIPVKEEFYSDDERITTVSKLGQQKLSSPDNLLVNQAVDVNGNNSSDLSKKTILIVEDNFDLQDFLKQLLDKYYNILLAENGEEGFYHAKNNLPDLILSDIMMPVMDGIEMCRELQKENLTKHIPVVLLTAKNSTKAKIEGLKTGAIEYINKPFDTNELLLKINNILSSKELLLSKYRKEFINQPKIKVEKSQDETFLENLVSIVNERLSDSNFKVDELAEKLNMSHSSLYRKCLSLTGLNLADLIKQHRLKKAAILIVKYGYTISETAYKVGFNDPKYFSKSFKNKYGVTPKQFKKSASNAESIEDYLKTQNIDLISS